MARSNHFRPELIVKDNLQKLKSKTDTSNTATLTAHKPDYSSPPVPWKIGYPNGEELSLLFETVRAAIGARKEIAKREHNQKPVGKRLLATAANLDNKKAKLKDKFSPLLANVFLYALLTDNEKEPYASALDWLVHWQHYHLHKFSSFGFSDLMDALIEETFDEYVAAFQKSSVTDTTVISEKK